LNKGKGKVRKPDQNIGEGKGLEASLNKGNDKG